MPVLMDNKGPKRQCNIYSAKFTKRGSNSQNKKIITWETGLLRHNLKHQSYSSLNWFLTFQHWDCLKKRRMDALASNGAHQSCLTSPMVASQLCWWKPYVKPTRVGASAAPSLAWFKWAACAVLHPSFLTHKIEGVFWQITLSLVSLKCSVPTLDWCSWAEFPISIHASAFLDQETQENGKGKARAIRVHSLYFHPLSSVRHEIIRESTRATLP